MIAAALALAMIGVTGWRYYLLVLSAPLALFLMVSWWMPESPRYLLITGKTEQLKSLFQRISSLNGKEISLNEITNCQVESRGRLLEIFSSRWRSTTFLLSILWFASAFCYFGIPLLTTAMFQNDINGCGHSAMRSSGNKSTINSGGRYCFLMGVCSYL